jgi:RimJ/RimL family protein N-acetyltransferase
MLGRVDFAPLLTARLRLEPVTTEMARGVVAGDLSALAAAGLTAAEGWPHDDTVDGLTMPAKTGEPGGWLIVAGDAVIGDCGTHGPVDEAGVVEIGYGLAAPSRGQCYGSEAVAAITEWLLARPEVRQIRACTLVDNTPSRRVLEKAGFTYTGIEDDEAIYRQDAPSS